MVKIIVFLLMVCFFFKLISWGAFYFYPGESYQRYTKAMGYKINGASAIGDPYQGQPFKIAFLGDSSLGNGGITQKLKGLLGPDSVHIDNFSVASMDKHALIGQMKALYLKGRHYQVLLFSIINSDYPFIYHFSYRWRSDKKLQQWFYRHRQRDPFLSSSTPINKTEEVKRILAKAMGGEYLGDKVFFVRQFPEITSRLVPIKKAIFDQYKEKLLEKVSEEDIVEVKKWASRIADKIYFIPSLVAYHPKALPSYEKIYAIIHPTFDFQATRPHFYNLPSVVQIFEHVSNRISSICEKHGIETLTYKTDLFYAMETTEGLFVDEMHLSPKGHTEGAKYIARKIAPLLREKSNSGPR